MIRCTGHRNIFSTFFCSFVRYSITANIDGFADAVRVRERQSSTQKWRIISEQVTKLRFVFYDFSNHLSALPAYSLCDGYFYARRLSVRLQLVQECMCVYVGWARFSHIILL